MEMMSWVPIFNNNHVSCFDLQWNSCVGLRFSIGIMLFSLWFVMKTNIFWALLCNKILCWAVISNGDHVPVFDFQHKACSEFDLEWKLCFGVRLQWTLCFGFWFPIEIMFRASTFALNYGLASDSYWKSCLGINFSLKSCFGLRFSIEIIFRASTFGWNHVSGSHFSLKPCFGHQLLL